MPWCASALIPTEMGVSPLIDISPTNCWVIIDFRCWSGICARIASNKHLLSLSLGNSSGSLGAGFSMILLPTSTLLALLLSEPFMACIILITPFTNLLCLLLLCNLKFVIPCQRGTLEPARIFILAHLNRFMPNGGRNITIFGSWRIRNRLCGFIPPLLLVKNKYFEHLDTSTTLSNGDLAIGKDPHLSTFLLLQWMIS